MRDPAKFSSAKDVALVSFQTGASPLRSSESPSGERVRRPRCTLSGPDGFARASDSVKEMAGADPSAGLVDTALVVAAARPP